MSDEEVRQAVKDTLEREGKQPLSKEEKEAARQLFDKYDTDNNGTIDGNELRSLLKTEFSMKDADVNQVMSKFDQNKDNKMDFEEFCQLCQFNRNAVMMGVAMDALTVAAYAKWGCYCCLCTACLSWIPYFCKIRQMQSRILSGEYQKQALKTSTPAEPAAAAGTADKPATADPTRA